MNNIVQLHPKTNPFPQESDLYFNVWERPLHFTGKNAVTIDDVYSVPSHKAIVRLDPYTADPLSIGIVGRSYKVIHTKDICQAVENIFMEKMTDEELQEVRVRDEVAYNGGTCIRQYVFPNINEQINEQSTVGFRTVIVNGYDGSSSFKLYSGAIDFFCSNGMVTGTFDLVAKKHTSGFQIPRLIKRLRDNIDIFYKQADQWKHWANKAITDEDAKETFEAMPNVSERRVEQLMRQFHIECLTHGRTVWALYSAATYYATHNEGEFKVRSTKTNHEAVTLLNREQQVRSWVSSGSFARLVA